jgi:hypothetical protein
VKTFRVAIAGLLAATYAWQLLESFFAGNGLQWIHIFGLALALALVVVLTRGRSRGDSGAID